jgi:hypothetical protein
MFTVVKRNKRMWIDQDGQPSYTPPNFIRLSSRFPLQCLAAVLNAVEHRDINLIVEFEALYNSRKPKAVK